MQEIFASNFAHSSEEILCKYLLLCTLNNNILSYYIQKRFLATKQNRNVYFISIYFISTFHVFC